MKPKSGKTKLTVEDYMGLPDDGRRYQVLDGELDVMPAPRIVHQRLICHLVRLMEPLEAMGLFRIFPAPVDVILDRHTVVQPDVVLVRLVRLSIVGELNIQGPPDVLIEILSPSRRRLDRVTKKAIYAKSAVPYYWIVDPDTDSIDFYKLSGGSFAHVVTATAPAIARPEELAGLEIPLVEVFKP
jgi:Uma2 family endonuclease